MAYCKAVRYTCAEHDGKRYKASDIHVLKQFKDELHSGNYLYNVVHFVPGVIKAIGAGIYKFASKLFLSRKGRQAMEEVEKRLNGESENEECNLTEKDLEILFNEYIGTNVIEAKNDALNPLIIRKLREYGIQKAMKINEEITQRYNGFITAMNQIKLRKEQLNDSPENKAQLEDEINELYKFAAGLAREIRALKIEGNKILSGGGVHSLEEDFKAASTKMNYVGLGFTKEFGTDPELRQKMSELEIKLLNNSPLLVILP